ncbi:hypothetical protein D1632_05435 [Chryseobacterium nematophagum]|uniref:Uncharacterized protein n=1 Tax=Chryseobacterium nematophagum TaxID=2305228 RepID=A0A3M7LEE7_9FLAO|nr:hypothetical protein D1632_05435 [Chryseobacterium nematophagum]
MKVYIVNDNYSPHMAFIISTFKLGLLESISNDVIFSLFYTLGTTLKQDLQYYFLFLKYG